MGVLRNNIAVRKSRERAKLRTENTQKKLIELHSETQTQKELIIHMQQQCIELETKASRAERRLEETLKVDFLVWSSKPLTWFYSSSTYECASSSTTSQRKCSLASPSELLEITTKIHHLHFSSFSLFFTLNSWSSDRISTRLYMWKL